MDVGTIYSHARTHNTGQLGWAAGPVAPDSMDVIRDDADFGTRRGVRELSEIFQVLGRIFDGTSRRADPGGEVAAEFLRCVHDVVEVTVEPIPAVTTAQAGFDYDLLLV